MSRIGASWKKVLGKEFEKPYFLQLREFLSQERGEVYPPREKIFRAFELTPFEAVKVVIVGQDPYHGPGQAEGLCFSVPSGVPFPPSLKNIFLELHQDVGMVIPQGGSLVPWAEQGVFLLNTLLTVRSAEPLSHKDKGWEMFTDAVIHHLAQREEPLVFLLWGRSALEKVKGIPERHAVLTAPHPSPLSSHRGFFGCRHFSKANALLEQRGQSPIVWNLP